jgi:pimeloyl-ACP methyl ester carboxylesterase
MSLMRLSVLHDVPYAPEPNGNLVRTMYNRRRRPPVGRTAPLTPPDIVSPRSDLQHYVARMLDTVAAGLAPDAPVTVMIHGFLNDPTQIVDEDDPAENDNPHGRLYHFKDTGENTEIREHSTGWPLWLGFEADDAGRTGLAVAFAWQSKPGFFSSLIGYGKTFYERAYQMAEEAAWVLVNVVIALGRALGPRPIDLFCHSLGARVAIRALAIAAKRADAHEMVARTGRVILLGGAEYVVEAQLMMRRLAQLGRDGGPSFYNVGSRENDVLDILGENFGPSTFGSGQVIGHNGLGRQRSSTARNRDAWRGSPWMDLQIDSPALQTWMDERGITISGDREDSVWDHWYYYTFRGNMERYRNILRQRDAWSLERLRDQGIPEGFHVPGKD